MINGGNRHGWRYRPPAMNRRIQPGRITRVESAFDQIFLTGKECSWRRWPRSGQASLQSWSTSTISSLWKFFGCGSSVAPKGRTVHGSEPASELVCRPVLYPWYWRRPVKTPGRIRGGAAAHYSHMEEMPDQNAWKAHEHWSCQLPCRHLCKD